MAGWEAAHTDADLPPYMRDVAAGSVDECHLLVAPIVVGRLRT